MKRLRLILKRLDLTARAPNLVPLKTLLITVTLRLKLRLRLNLR
jgi:hypothetical protein